MRRVLYLGGYLEIIRFVYLSYKDVRNCVISFYEIFT